MRWRPVVLAAALLLAAPALLASSTANTDVPAPPGLPVARAVSPVRTVGALFAGPIGEGHQCSGSVVDSPSRDLVLTAAHCVVGSGTDLTFVPGYDRGATPLGTWSVVAVYEDPAWRDAEDPRFDYALLQVAPDGGRAIEDVTGGEVVTTTLGSRVTVTGYAAGVDDRPLGCVSTVFRTDGYPTFTCHGFVDGTSGSPWVRARRGQAAQVVGIVGGLEQGGCVDYTSYSPPFDAAILRLLARAAAHQEPDASPLVVNLAC
jgi:V8-like Glu-specific endopeptidase